MASYYYLISSLPTLSPNSPMPFSYDTFLEMCSTSVSDSTYKLLADLKLTSSEGPLVEEWHSFYSVLLSELTQLRSAKLGRTYKSDADRDQASATLAASAMNAADPLAAEKMLLAYEMDQLDQLVGLHYFDDYTLFGYALKLRLLERFGSFEHERGKEEFSDILGSLQKQVTNL